jgi:putative DNA primase/helicase
VTDAPLFGSGATSIQAAEWLARVGLERQWLYDHSLGQWHHWNGVLWATDDTDAISLAVSAAAARALTPDSPLAPKSEAEAKMLASLFSRPRRESILRDLAAFPDYGTDGQDWDTNPNLLGCANGIVDLRTNSIVPSDPRDRVSRSTKVDFHPIGSPAEFATAAPLFMDFLYDVTSDYDHTPDPALVWYLLKWFGLGLFGTVVEQKFLLLTGTGRNGKGALKHAIMSAVGEYGLQADANLYSRAGFGPARASDARSDLMLLRGKRLVFCSEPDKGKFNEEMLKAHTGGDIITARGLFQKIPQSWLPTHTITFLVNDAPQLDDIGASMAARTTVADFRHRYDGDAEDVTLYDKLAAEKEGVLSILVYMAMLAHQNIQRGVSPLDGALRVVEQSKQFIERNDPVAEFLREVCVEGPDEKTTGGYAYDAFRDWHQSSQREGDPISNVKFADQLKKKGMRNERTRTGVVWTGFRPLRGDELAERATNGDE